MENIDLYNNDNLLDNAGAEEFDEELDGFGEVVVREDDDDEIIEDVFEDIDNF